MLTMLKTNSLKTVTFCLTFVFSTHTLATQLLLKAPGASVIVVAEQGQVKANATNKKMHYIISKSFSDHLKRSYEASLINTYAEKRGPVFFIFTREPSAPNSMGQGYCGAGYEDFLLLVKLEKRTFKLTDTYLLQSCLHSKSMRIERSGLNPQDELHLNSDGSYNFEMIDDSDGKIWNIKISQEKFFIKNIKK